MISKSTSEIVIFEQLAKISDHDLLTIRDGPDPQDDPEEQQIVEVPIPKIPLTIQEGSDLGLAL